MQVIIRKTILLTMLVMVGVTSQICMAQILRFNPSDMSANGHSITVEQWQVADIEVAVNGEVENPFTLTADAIFTHSSGERKTIALIYNGRSSTEVASDSSQAAHRWLIRFSSGLTGKWTYQTRSALSKLNNLQGEIEIRGNTNPDQHGAMVISADNPQAFAYEDGTPYFLIGYELDWLYSLDYHNDEAMPKSEHLLSLIRDNGFNHVVMNVFAYDVTWHKDTKLNQFPEHDFGAPEDIFPFLGNNENPDFSALNVEFFQKLDRTIALMQDKQLIAHLMIYVWNKKVNWPAMNSAADDMYFDYVVKRYGAFSNIVWDISKEALFYGRADEAYIKNRIERLRSNNVYQRLVTVHDYKYCAKYPEQVDFISVQDWWLDVYQRMHNIRNKFPDKPSYNIEHGGYEESPYLVFPGDYVNAEVSLRRNWMSIFAGVYSTYYWQGTSWNVVIYNPFEQGADFYKPKFHYFRAMADFFQRFDFATFAPEPGKNGSGYTLIDAQQTYLIYVPKENYQMSRGDWYLHPNDANPKRRTYQWFNTHTGEYSEVKNITKGTQFISPWRGESDAILISELILESSKIQS